MGNEEFAKEAIDIVSRAEEKGIILRILGALAVYIHSKHCEECLNLYERLERLGAGEILFTDLDLIAYSKQRREVMKFFEKEMMYKPDKMIIALTGGRRLIYYHPNNAFHVDIFFDKLEFSHDVVFGNKPGRGRLELDFPTITLADLVLEKTQIHEINRKDIIDLIILFLGHEVGEASGREVINGKYIASVLSKDWGFWYDATNNLRKVEYFTKKFLESNKMECRQYKTIVGRINRLMSIIEAEPKSKKWLKRAKTGTSKPWYRSVEEISR